MGGVHDRAVTHVMQRGQMTTATSNHGLPPCFIASTGAAMMEHAQQHPLIHANPRALTSIYHLMDQPAAAQNKVYKRAAWL